MFFTFKPVPPQSCIPHSAVHPTVRAAYYLYQVRIHLNLFPCQPHRGAHCMATGFRHNKTNLPISHVRQLTRPRLPDYGRSLDEDREGKKERIGRREDRWERSSCDSQGVLYRFTVQSSLSLVSFCPQNWAQRRRYPHTSKSLYSFLDWPLTNSPRSVDWFASIDQFSWEMVLGRLREARHCN